MMIHSTAVIDPQAKIAKSVRIGPYVIVGTGVQIGEGSCVEAHSVLRGPDIAIGMHNEIGPNVTFLSHTTIGDHNKFLPYSVVGAPPQDLKFKGENSRIEIGDRNIIRECVTINRGTLEGGGITKVGNDNLIMAYVHIAHDCHIGNHVVIANSVGLSGHVSIEDYAILGGMVGITQFCRVGTFAYVGGFSRTSKDIPPYVLASPGGIDLVLKGINSIGLKRKGVDSYVIRKLKDAFRILFVSNLTLQEGVDKVKKELVDISQVKYLIEFIEKSKQGIASRDVEKYVGKAKSSRYWRGIPRELPL